MDNQSATSPFARISIPPWMNNTLHRVMQDGQACVKSMSSQLHKLGCPSRKDGENAQALKEKEPKALDFKAKLAKQLQAWRENNEWVDTAPKIEVTVPKGTLCNLKAIVQVGLPPDAVFDIVIDPENKRVFKNIKEVTYRKVLEDDGYRQLVEVEQAAMWRFLWWSGTIAIRVYVDQDRRNHLVTEPLVSLLRIADAEKPSMGYIYEGMDRAKEAIRAQYGGVHEKYAPIWEIIDRRWQNQLHRPIHAAAYYLNPAFRFRHDFKADEEVHTGLFTVIQRLSCDEDSLAATIELDKFNNKEGPSFSSKMAIDAQKSLQPDRWWQLFGSGTPKLQKIATRILSQPSSASGCERSWSMFEHIHSKRRNRLSVQRLNDLVFVHYNLRLRIRQILGVDSSPIILEEIDPESEWLTEAVDPVFTEEDHEWVDQVDREAEAVAIAEEEARARSGTGRLTRSRTDTARSGVVREPILHAGAMAQQSSRTYLRRLCRGQRDTGYSEAEAAAAAELEDDDEDDDEA